jgi:hypothetical protein
MRASGGWEDLTAGKAAVGIASRQDLNCSKERKENDGPETAFEKSGPREAVRELRAEDGGPRGRRKLRANGDLSL